MAHREAVLGAMRIPFVSAAFAPLSLSVSESINLLARCGGRWHRESETAEHAVVRQSPKRSFRT